MAVISASLLSPSACHARVRCPTCGRPVESDDAKRPASFPFCCERCRLLDLGAWFDGRRAIPGPPLGEDEDGTRP